MKTTPIIIIILSFLMNPGVFAQIHPEDLNGKWFTNNDDDMYYKRDTVVFYRDSINNACRFKSWKIKKKKIEIRSHSVCYRWKITGEPWGREKIKIRKKDFGQVLNIYINGILIEKFRIVVPKDERYLKTARAIDTLLSTRDVPYLKTGQAIDTLQLMRFDDLSGQKLYKYVDSLVFKVLKYKPNPVTKEKTVSAKDSIRTKNLPAFFTPAPEDVPGPLLVINGFPLKNRDILKELLLAETYEIKVLHPGAETFAIYGSQARYGVIIIQTSEKRLKKLRKKFRD